MYKYITHSILFSALETMFKFKGNNTVQKTKFFWEVKEITKNKL